MVLSVTQQLYGHNKLPCCWFFFLPSVAPTRYNGISSASAPFKNVSVVKVKKEGQDCTSERQSKAPPKRSVGFVVSAALFLLFF